MPDASTVVARAQQPPSVGRELDRPRRALTADQLRNLAGGNDAGPRGTVVYQCGTLISCAACTELQCILNTSVITSCG